MPITLGEALDALKDGRNITYPGMGGHVFYDPSKQAIYRTWDDKPHFNGSDLAREDWQIID